MSNALKDKKASGAKILFTAAQRTLLEDFVKEVRVHWNHGFLGTMTNAVIATLETCADVVGNGGYMITPADDQAELALKEPYN